MNDLQSSLELSRFTNELRDYLSLARPKGSHKPLHQEDVQCIILSKLPLKEAVRTSVLSSKWRNLWTICPKLRFDGTVMFGKKMNGKQREQYARQFIDTVNVVLHQCHGKVVEELVIKFNFDSLLIDHLNNWVRFAASSHTKSLSFDLTPRGLEVFGDPQYIFPFKLFDSRCISHLQLHFVSIKLPTQFCGFPKLRKLDLRNVKVSAKELEYMLSNCSSLEWFSIAFCNMNGELKVQSPLPRLLCLNVSCCELTEMEFHAVKLRTFVYEGSAVPINLTEVSELKNANIIFTESTIGNAIPALANALTNVQNLTLNIYVHPPEVPCLIENPSIFSHLKHLQLLLCYNMDVDNLSLVSFLGTALFIEKLEIHFSSVFGFYLMKGTFFLRNLMKGTSIRRLKRTYNYLKDVCITGFQASSGQIEFLVHIVENTPALEVLTVDPLDRLMKGEPLLVIEREVDFIDGAYRIVREYIEKNVSPKYSVRLLL
ncbi:hypothetical protein C2845_PM01G47970 [Panicum miliaceum]|uniref:F-box domain-containing protein n=1 Tax=Panicum miliaceum TaxID=4540 RepID=A0A3L6TS22_PANMI|nr:hypothetical protein C2845_PM01G47970 [Panicum miliaceum]